MNSDTSRPDPVTDIDPRLSAAYRDLAAQTTPTELDRRVLDQAAAALRSRPLGRMRRWTRPLAWAATITLCAAIVLEISRMPGPDGQSPMPALDIESAAPAARQPPGRPVPAAQKQALYEAAATEPAEVPAASPQNATPPDMARERKLNSEKIEPQVRMASPSQDQATMPEAAERHDADMSSNQGLVMPAATTIGDDAAAPACDAELRTDPDRWFACISELELQGEYAAADRERDLFVEAFPDFLRY